MVRDEPWARCQGRKDCWSKPAKSDDEALLASDSANELTYRLGHKNTQKSARE